MRFANTIMPMLLLASLTAPARADVITDWNTVWLDCVRATGGGPGPISRAGAVVHVAMYDAVNAIDGNHQAWLLDRRVPSSWPIEAAAAQAAHDALLNFYPGQSVLIEDALAQSLAPIPASVSVKPARQLGRLAALKAIHDRKKDGSEATDPFPSSNIPGVWRPTPPDYSAAIGPVWGHVRPFTMESGDQFRPLGPFGYSTMAEVLASAEYAAVVNEVKDLGSLTSASRSAEQTDIAFFWANDVNGSYKPPGHLNVIAQVLSEQQGLSTPERARLFALLNIALAEAGIVAWDCKYQSGISLWRPISAVREADTDGNPATSPDPGWEPLNPFSPPFPAYVSGHATFSAAAAAIFRNYFGTDNITHTLGTDDPFYSGSPTRTFHSFTEAALENGRSRIYLGVHFQCDADEGYSCGTHLGNYVFENALRPIEVAGLNRATHLRTSSVDSDLTDAEWLLSDLSLPPIDTAMPVADSAPASQGHLAARRQGSDIQLSYRAIPGEPIKVDIVDIQGRSVATLFEGAAPDGEANVLWNGTSRTGGRVASGVYLAHLAAGGEDWVQKVVLSR